MSRAGSNEVDEIIQRGQDASRADDLLQEAGDSLMMKLGESAHRISRLDVLARLARLANSARTAIRTEADATIL